MDSDPEESAEPGEDEDDEEEPPLEDDEEDFPPENPETRYGYTVS
jgi:hypothetical protein